MEAFFFGVLASIVAGIILEASFGISFRGLLSRRLLALPSSGPLSLVVGVPWRIVPGSDDLHETKGMPIFGYGPLMAVNNLYFLLRTARKKGADPKFLTSDSVKIEDRKEDIILIGYPKGNEETEKFLDEIQPRLYFDGHNVLRRDGGDVAYQPVYSGDEVVEDFGYLYQGRNPFAQDKRVIILAGCETYGVQAASSLLSSSYINEIYGVPKFIPRLFVTAYGILAFRSPKKRERGLIVKCKVKDHLIYDLEVVDRF